MVYNNTLNGINLTNSNWNTVFNNTENDNIRNGIIATNSSGNALYKNTARYNYQDGILLNQSSDGNNVTANIGCAEISGTA